MAALLIVAVVVAVLDWALFAATCEDDDERCPDIFEEDDY